MNKQDLIDLHFKGATELYKSELIEKGDYYIFSNLLIDDCYWNMVILKNFDTIQKRHMQIWVLKR